MKELIITGKIGLTTINARVPPSHALIHDLVIDKMFERYEPQEGLDPFVDVLKTTLIFSEKMILCGFVTTLDEHVVRMCMLFVPKVDDVFLVISFDGENFKTLSLPLSEVSEFDRDTDKVQYPDSIRDWVNNIDVTINVTTSKEEPCQK